MRNYIYNNFSGWLDQPEHRQAPLDEAIAADVVIVGGGFTGLSTALSLRERNYDVVLLEQDFAGSGSSGRNAGHISPTIGKDIPTLVKVFGEERARQLVRFSEASIEYTEDTIRKYDIECEYEANGNIVAAVDISQKKSVQGAFEAAKRFSGHVHYLDENEMRQRELPQGFKFGFHEELGGLINPGLYVQSLRAAAIRQGVRIFEDTPVTSLEDGRDVIAQTRTGSVRAKKAVLATNAYTKSTGRMKRAVHPLRITLFETAPLSASQMQEVGWIRREGIYTAHEILENYRLTARNTIIGGSRTFRSAFGGGMPSGYHPKTFDLLENVFRERFPMLSDLPVRQFWGGWIGVTPDFLPRIGVIGKAKNIFYGLGFNGHGIPQATMMGDMLAHKIDGQTHECESALDRRAFGWPPEPLLSIGSKTLSWYFHAADRRTDQKIRSTQGV